MITLLEASPTSNAAPCPVRGLARARPSRARSWACPARSQSPARARTASEPFLQTALVRDRQRPLSVEPRRLPLDADDQGHSLSAASAGSTAARPGAGSPAGGRTNTGTGAARAPVPTSQTGPPQAIAMRCFGFADLWLVLGRAESTFARKISAAPRRRASGATSWSPRSASMAAPGRRCRRHSGCPTRRRGGRKRRALCPRTGARAPVACASWSSRSRTWSGIPAGAEDFCRIQRLMVNPRKPPALRLFQPLPRYFQGNRRDWLRRWGRTLPDFVEP